MCEKHIRPCYFLTVTLVLKEVDKQCEKQFFSVLLGGGGVQWDRGIMYRLFVL